MGASLRSFPGAVALNHKVLSSTMQSFIWISCCQVFSPQCGLTRHHHSTDAPLHPNPRNHSMSDGLDYELADVIPKFDDNTQSQWPETEIFPKPGAPINDTVQVQSFENDDWDRLAPFATPQQWQLCHCIVDTNLGQTKLNNILKWRLSLPDANVKNPDQLYQLIADVERIDRLGCGWEESSINIQGKGTLFWYQNPIAAVWYMLGHPLLNNQLLYVAVKQMDSTGELIYAEMWTGDWWWKAQASVLVLSERACQREHVRESVSDRTCQRVSESDCQRECVREHVRDGVRDRHSQIVGDCVSELHWVRAGSVSGLSAPVLTGFLCILEPHDSLLTRPRNHCQTDKQLSPLYSAVTKLCCLR